ncbi:hypothetical protein ACFCX4_20650 [Kitasatospora sp. NPDC056327]|uniref:hypothetical protein n=1 Tax=Kitasatospora sp. NPDC056327 TaxID=3345785 RepID=UPI0035D7C474
MRPRFLIGIAATAVLLTAGPAPGAEALPQATAAAPPSVDPWAPTRHYAPGTSAPDCPGGNFCAHVWDASSRDYVVFFLGRCATYALANWDDRGWYTNQQTGTRATATLYGRSGNKLKDIPIGAGSIVDWSPVWSIRNCY